MEFYLLSALFLGIALIYSSVGFGGGSSYIAVLLLYQIQFDHIPIVALACNIIVVTGSSIRHIKHKNFNWKFLIPFLITSIPFAYLGGSIPIDKALLKTILGICLLLAGFRMIFLKNIQHGDFKFPPLWISLLLGLSLGFVSGLVGIGGGIFLSPVLFNMRWGKAKEITAICSLFIFFNSISGLIGQMHKIESLSVIYQYWPLFIAVIIGGQIGSHLNIKKLNPRMIEVLTALLVLLVSFRVLFF